MKRLFLSLLPLAVAAQTAQPLKQQSLDKWNIGTAQYSGITAIADGRYAMVSDKETTDGFFLFRIAQNANTGEVTQMFLEGFKGNPNPKLDANGISIRDCEGVAYFPPTNTLFISGEGDQRVLEYTMDGKPTGRELRVPDALSLKNIVGNYGFEALCYDTASHRFWTMTESTLPADGDAASAAHPTTENLLRLQSFNDNLQPTEQYAYRMDAPQTKKFGRTYVFGVSEVAALADGRLLVLEREANVTSVGVGSKCYCKLYLVDPSSAQPLTDNTPLKSVNTDRFLKKKLLTSWTTQVSPLNLNFANYEGMCLGRTLADGRQTLLVVNDSQGGYHKGPFRLKDYIKVVILGN